MKASILEAARANDIPAGAAGTWHIKKLRLSKHITAPKDGKQVWIPAGDYTQLWKWTLETIQTRLNCFDDITNPPGELVMTDSPDELNTHLEFMLRARGRVLVTGLGLGCVVRGCLANPAVEHVVCIERDGDVLKMVQPHMPTKGLTILRGDAVSWVRNNVARQRFDCAWHDLWSDPDLNEPNLALTHSELFVQCHGHVGFQGAWAFPKVQKRQWKRTVGNIIG
jgi:hypothetical protein